ncbi:hypothetical protein PAMA_008852 [Pampus argenteus]
MATGRRKKPPLQDEIQHAVRSVDKMAELEVDYINSYKGFIEIRPTIPASRQHPVTGTKRSLDIRCVQRRMMRMMTRQPSGTLQHSKYQLLKHDSPPVLQMGSRVPQETDPVSVPSPRRPQTRSQKPANVDSTEDLVEKEDEWDVPDVQIQPATFQF